MRTNKNMAMVTKNWLIEKLLEITALISIIVLALIVVFLIKEAVPIFQEVSVKDFLLGQEWYPTSEPVSYGIFPLIMASIVVTLLSSLLAVPLGVGSAIYLSEVAQERIREVIKPMLELLAALPSVVIGLFGMVVIAPFLQETFDLPTGLNVLNASLMLALMAIPTISSISEDALNTVPNSLREGSLALGATSWETIVRVILPAALPGVSTAVILGMARSIGETMVVLMVAGGAAIVPQSIFDPARPIPASIAAEMGEAAYHSHHYYALFATGAVLFLMTFAFNIVAEYISHRFKQHE